jgi:hypothetical protein
MFNSDQIDGLVGKAEISGSKFAAYCFMIFVPPLMLPWQ